LVKFSIFTNIYYISTIIVNLTNISIYIIMALSKFESEQRRRKENAKRFF